MPHLAHQSLHLSADELLELLRGRSGALLRLTEACIRAVEVDGPEAWAKAVVVYLLDPEASARVWFIARSPGFWQRCGFAQRHTFDRFADVHSTLVADRGFVFAARAAAGELQHILSPQVEHGGKR